MTYEHSPDMMPDLLFRLSWLLISSGCSPLPDGTETELPEAATAASRQRNRPVGTFYTDSGRRPGDERSRRHSNRFVGSVAVIRRQLLQRARYTAPIDPTGIAEFNPQLID
jgi:hypothetical protein